MRAHTAAKFEAMGPAVKREWVKRLARTLAPSPLATPYTLGLLMEETYLQLCDGLRARPTRAWLRRSAPMIAPRQRHGSCSLIPLLNYYAAGDQAVRAVAGAHLRSPELEEILLFLHTLAQQDIGALCGECLHKHGPACDRGLAFAEAPRQGGKPSRPRPRAAEAKKPPQERRSLARHTVGDSPTILRKTRLNCESD